MKLKLIIRKVREFDYSDILKIICFLGFIVILLISTTGCTTLTDKDNKEFKKEFDRHQPKEYRGEK